MFFTKRETLYSALRYYLFFLVFCISATLCGVYMRNPFFDHYLLGFWNPTLYYRVNFWYSLFMFFSFASVSALNDIELKKAFSERNREHSIFRFAITNRYFLLESAIIFVLSFLFLPLSPFNDLISGYFIDLEIPVQLRRIFAVLILYPAFFIINFLSHLSTCTWWSRQGRKKKAEKYHHPIALFFMRCAPTVILWLIGGFSMAMVYPMLSSFFVIFDALKIPLLIMFILLLIASALLMFLRYQRTVALRKRLVKQIRRIAKSEGFEVVLSEDPYSSYVADDRKYHFMIKRDGAEIACRFISQASKISPLYLHENGDTQYEKDRFFFKHSITDRYFFDAEVGVKKIVIACPCKGKIIVKREGAERLLDVGDKVMEYKIYNSSGFINAIERNCI